MTPAIRGEGGVQLTLRLGEGEGVGGWNKIRMQPNLDAYLSYVPDTMASAQF